MRSVSADERHSECPATPTPEGCDSATAFAASVLLGDDSGNAVVQPPCIDRRGVATRASYCIQTIC